jgi:hypothetical protein
MLTIVIDSWKFTKRPKYRPKSKWNQWKVYDTVTKKVVFGPETHSRCMTFIRSKECPY